MLPDKVRIKKYQQPKIEEWSKALEIPPSKLIEEAINVYLRQLEGKTVTPITTPSIQPEEQQVKVEQLDPDEEDFDGGIEL